MALAKTFWIKTMSENAEAFGWDVGKSFEKEFARFVAGAKDEIGLFKNFLLKTI
ncbi:MAG: hypothetical protein R3B54_07340 [Bdellovibrionota bacterium]